MKDKDKQTPPNDEYVEEFQVEPEGGEAADIMADLWETGSDLPVGDDSEPEEAEEEPEEAEEAEEEEVEEESDEEPEAEAAEEPEKTFKVKDKEYDLDTLVKEGVLEDLITQASQVAHFQKLYEELKGQQTVAQQVQQQPQPQPQMLNVEQIKAQLAPQIHAAVQEGWMEPEFIQDYPSVAASQMMAYMDLLQVKQLVMGMYNYFTQTSAKEMYQNIRNNYDSSCIELTTKDDIYKALANDSERDAFFQFLAETVNPSSDALTPEFLASQYLGFKHAVVLESMRGGKNVKKKLKKKKKKLATGEGGSARKGSKKAATSKSTDDTVMSGLMEHFDV